MARNPNQFPSPTTDAQIERQLDTEELHSQLGRTGLGRLVHPVRNGTIAFTVLNRMRKGEYDPRLLEPVSRIGESGLVDPFYEDPLEIKRDQRTHSKIEAERKAELYDPFSEGPVDEEALERTRARLHNPFLEDDRVASEEKPIIKNPFLDD